MALVLTDIIAQAASYLRRPITDLTANVISNPSGPLNVALPALNMIRTDAESANDFEFTFQQVDVVVTPGTPCALTSAVLHGTDTPAIIKTICDVGIYDLQANLWPLEWTDGGENMERIRQEARHFLFARYPTDDQFNFRFWGVTRPVFTGGPQGFVNIYPVQQLDTQPTITLGILAYTLTPDWTGETTAAVPYTTLGAKWLTWALVCELNPLFKTFVPRQEGNLGEPSEKRDMAWQRFVDWDLLAVQQHRRHER